MNGRGLTILEILISLSIIAIVTGIALPSFATLRAQSRLNAAARQIVLDLKVARARAIGDLAGHRVRFVVRAPTYQHQRQRGDGSYADDGAPVALPDGVGVE